MSGNSIWAVVGFVVVFLVILTAVKICRNKSEHYDERQLQIRGNGYRISFMTTVLLNIVYSAFLYGFTKEIVAPQFVVITIAFIGIAVYAIYCIFNDAYLQVGQKSGVWMLVIVFVIVTNIFAAARSSERGLIVDGFATGSSMNIMVASLFGLILISLCIKRLMDKRGDAHEES